MAMIDELREAQADYEHKISRLEQDVQKLGRALNSIGLIDDNICNAYVKSLNRYDEIPDWKGHASLKFTEGYRGDYTSTYHLYTYDVDDLWHALADLKRARERELEDTRSLLSVVQQQLTLSDMNDRYLSALETSLFSDEI